MEGSDTTVIESWITGTNAGMLIKDDPRQGNAPDYQYWAFNDSECATEALRPKLTVEYTIPEPATMMTLLVAGVVGLVLRRLK